MEKTMFRIEMLPAAHGDCLWITFGSAEDPRYILIDGGMRYTYKHLRSRILALPPGHRRIELLIITHVDADHIEGCIRLLQDEKLGLHIGEIWFNGQPQLDGLPDPAGLDVLGAEQGEFLGALIRQLEETSGRLLWNTSFDGKAVMVPQAGDLVSKDINGLKLTIVSPGIEQLFELKDEWDKVIEDAGFEPGDIEEALRRLAERSDLAPPDVLGGAEEVEESEFDDVGDEVDLVDVLGESEADFGSDSSPANGSSIAVIAEWEGKHYLLSGDAYAHVMAASLDRWRKQENNPNGSPSKPVKLELFKLPHHGSVSNISEELLELIKCRRYLFSSSGKIFGHPHDRTVELILRKHQARGKALLFFNYQSGRTERWGNANDPLAQEHKWEANFPTGLAVEINGK
jgi:beta-lactamase superfamily II metal-dependent hydrolase